MRGAEYAWANAKRLQRALDEAGIAYRHLPELAPTTELRQLQYAQDARGRGQAQPRGARAGLRRALPREILARAPLPELPAQGLAALFCVERDPEACHRSLVAAAIAGDDVLHLRPRLLDRDDLRHLHGVQRAEQLVGARPVELSG